MAIAQKHNWNPSEYHLGMALLKKAETNQDLSDSDWLVAKDLAKNPVPDIAHQAFACMMHFKTSPKRSEAIQIANSNLAPGHPALIRAASLAILYHLNAPGWQVTAPALIRRVNQKSVAKRKPLRHTQKANRFIDVHRIAIETSSGANFRIRRSTKT